jgi:hypothetical protein
MGGADHQQPEAANEIAVDAIAACHLRPVHQQQHRCTEQQREQPAHLAIDEDEGEQPCQPVRHRLSAPGIGVEIGAFRHRKGDDVHEQYAHHGETADQIYRRNAILGRGEHVGPSSCREMRIVPLS